VLKWTGAGAVAAPDVLQVRLTTRFPGRVEAGAPAPSRELSDDEARANVRFFAVEKKGPRGSGITGLVLSGFALADRPGLAGVIADARSMGVTRVTAHVARGEGRAVGEALPVDAAAVTVAADADLDDVSALRVAGRFVTAVLLLDDATLPRLQALASGLAGVRPDRVVMTWPFPGGSSTSVPHADAVSAALPDPVAALEAAGIPTGIKGLPACALGALHQRFWRSGNRWYVDADHQKDRALLFFPDVVRFARTDECRFCAAAERCDGVPETWWREGRVGRLRAFESPV
jgi:hypothetical protein